MVMSVPFLVATAAVYFPRQRSSAGSLHATALAFHALCLAAAFFALAVMQLVSHNVTEGFCRCNGQY